MSLDWAITGAFLTAVIALAVGLVTLGLLITIDLWQTTFRQRGEF